MGKTTILMKFFGRLPNQSLSDFNKEIKQLTEADKVELVELAAKELGVDVD